MRFHEAVHGVYFDDLDALQILHNARYLLLFERTIGSLWQRLALSEGHHLVRTNHIEYLRPVTQLGEVRVRVWVEKIGRSSLTFGFRLLPMDEDVDYALGSRVIVSIDPKTRRPIPWTDELRQKIAPYLRQVGDTP